jgi:pimeloyl-ACP methyl ester carboxylesterase
MGLSKSQRCWLTTSAQFLERLSGRHLKLRLQLRERLTESPPPTISLVGEKTLLAPRAVARQLAPALAAATVVVSGAAHMIPITHPEAVVDAIRRDVVAANRSEEARA